MQACASARLHAAATACQRASGHSLVRAGLSKGGPGLVHLQRSRRNVPPPRPLLLLWLPVLVLLQAWLLSVLP
jgi:hypothetical protein